MADHYLTPPDPPDDDTARIPTYLSHSYRVPDRGVNRFFHELFWDNGFALTVDPQSYALSTTHLETMMRDSACFVAVVPRRDEQPRYRCSPFAVYEYGLAVQAHKPRLIIIEAGVPRWCFPEDDRTIVFNRRHLHAKDYAARIAQLGEESRAHAGAGDRALGSVGLLLPPTPAYHEAAARIREVLHEAGYSPVRLELDDVDSATAAQRLDQLDFVVVDVAATATARLVPFVQGRFVPCVKLVHHRPGQAPPARIPRLLLDEALERGSAASEVAIWWNDPNELEYRLRRRVQPLHAPRREFLSRTEGLAYFRSLGRTRGPVFVSSAREDGDVARAVVDQLLSYNVRTFHYLYQNTLPVGELWKPSLPRKIEESQLFVPLLSREYWKSDWCRREYELAESLHRAGQLRMVPYFLDGVEEPEVEVQGVSVADAPRPKKAGRIAEHLDEHLFQHEYGPALTRYSSGPQRRPVPETDIAILTFLDEEYAAVRELLEDPERVNGTREVPNQYGWVTGTLTSEVQGAYHVVLALCSTGNENALLAARNTIDAFHPDCLLMVGVAGALDQELSLGDVVVSDRICGYEYGRVGQVFHPRPDWSFPADQSIAAAAHTMCAQEPDWSAEIGVAAPASPASRPRVVVGQVASGNKVVDDITNPNFAPVLRLWPRLVAVEMEALGGVLAVGDARERGHLIHFSMVRGISDRPLRTPRRTRTATAIGEQSQQRDLWKPRAAAAAATFATRLVRTAWPRPPRAPKI
ncbi:MAG TPA: TIR domain-containing protein [Rugosimonospora sp.]|nr:TIR domain-containing protein [Rugosimonospora sp.]